MRNCPESQLWLFQFHECDFFIKAWGLGKNIAYAKKENKHNKGGGGHLDQKIQIIKNCLEQALQLGQHIFTL